MKTSAGSIIGLVLVGSVLLAGCQAPDEKRQRLHSHCTVEALKVYPKEKAFVTNWEKRQFIVNCMRAEGFDLIVPCDESFYPDRAEDVRCYKSTLGWDEWLKQFSS